MKSRSVSITGATGFVGWHIAEAFRRDGWNVRAIVRPGSAKPLPEGVERLVIPLDGLPLKSAFVSDSVVVHCAGTIRGRDDAAFAPVNVEGTRAVVDAVNTSGAHLILISSQAAGGVGTPDRPRRETDEAQPVNAYGRSKLRAEEVVRSSAQAPWTILRPCAVYGPRDRGFLPLFQAARYGLFFRPTRGEMAFTLVAVQDLARAVVAAAEGTSDSNTFFVGHPQAQTADDILRTLSAVFRQRYRPRSLPAPLLRAAASAGDLAWRFGRQFVIDSGRYAELSAEGFVCATDHIRETLGFTAQTPLEEGFATTAEWYRENGWL